MKDFNKKISVIFYGPQGSGKGTQAKLLADKFNLFHLDTGDYLRKILYNPRLQKDKTIKKERKLNEGGKLNTPAWVLGVVGKRIEELIGLGQSVVMSGSPRTYYEAFGDGKKNGEIAILEKAYSKKNIFIFILNIPERETYKRNLNRYNCSVCKMPLLGTANSQSGIKKNCPFCGGKMVRRVDDNRRSISIRLKEYKERTEPIFQELKKRGYRVYKIDGTPAPYKIHEKIISYLIK